MDPTNPGGMAPAPGPFATSYMAAGFGTTFGTGFQNQQTANQQAGTMYAGSVTGSVANVPAMALASSTAVAAIAGPVLRGATSRGAQALGHGMGLIDPFYYAGGMWGAGSQIGLGMAGGGAADLGIMGSMGAGRMGAAAMGFAGGAFLSGGALAVAFGVSEMVRKAGQEMWQGHRQSVVGQSLLSQIGSSVAPGMSQSQMIRQGASLGTELEDMGRQVKVSLEDMTSITSAFKDMGLFSTTSTIREFKARLKTGMTALKEIAQATQSTVEESLQVFSELRQQGFYTMSDITAQAVRQRARESSSGISVSQQQAIGSVGAQTARSYGMRGRFGAEIANRNVQSISAGLRTGLYDEETIGELGGPEALGMRLAQQQMGFLSSSRGRALIAMSMGEGRSPEMGRLNAFLGGNMTTEDVVTRAAGRGLGTLVASGTREAREQFLPYANMAMVQMAASQSRMLYGSVDETSLRRMLGTMGVGWEEAGVTIRQAVGQRKAMIGEQEQGQAMATEAAWQRADDMTSLSRTAGVWWRTNYGLGLNAFGSDVSQSAQRFRGDVNRTVFGTPRRFESGPADYALAGDYFRHGGGSPNLSFAEDESRRHGWFGPQTDRRRVRDFIPSSVRRHLSVRGDVNFQQSSALSGGFGVSQNDLANIFGEMNQPWEMSPGQSANLNLQMLGGAGNFRSDVLAEANRLRYGATNAPDSLAPYLSTQSARGTQTEAITFALARRSGSMIPEGYNYNDFIAGKIPGLSRPQDRVRLSVGLGRSLSSNEDERIRELIPGYSGLAGMGGQITDLTTERANFETTLSDIFQTVDPNWYGAVRGNAKATIRAVSEDSATRGAMKDVLDLLADPIGSEDYQVRLNSAMETLKKQLGGDQSDEWKGFQSMYNRLRKYRGTDPNFHLKWVRGGRQAFERRGAAEVMGSRMTSAQRALGRMDLDSDPRVSADILGNLKTLKGIRDPSKYDEVLGNVFASAAMGKHGLTDDEEEFLNQALGSSRLGTGLQTLMSGLTSSDEKTRRETVDLLTALSKDQKQAVLSGLSSGDPAAKQRAIYDAIRQGKGGSLIQGFIGGKTTSLEGMQAEYIDANARFVTAVGRFFSALGSMLGKEQLKALSAEVDKEGGSMG